MSNAFRTYDVFTPEDKPFTGNPLALFLDATGFSEELMISIAREFNLSETCFVTALNLGLNTDEQAHPRSLLSTHALGRRLSEPGFGLKAIPRPEYALRIFTTLGELPFAGHPIIGAAHYLGDAGLLGRLRDGDVRRLVVGAGIVDVRYKLNRKGRVETVEIAAPQAPLFEELGMARNMVSSMISLDEDEVMWADWLRPMFVSCGSAFLLVPVVSAAALAKVKPNHIIREAAVAERLTYPHTNTACISGKLYCYTILEDGAIEARMFPLPGAAFSEDPATGSAATCLAAYLAKHTAGLSAGRHQWTIKQGACIGRPSLLHVAADLSRDGTVTKTYVAGRAVMVSYGAMRL